MFPMVQTCTVCSRESQTSSEINSIAHRYFSYLGHTMALLFFFSGRKRLEELEGSSSSSIQTTCGSNLFGNAIPSTLGSVSLYFPKGFRLYVHGCIYFPLYYTFLAFYFHSLSHHFFSYYSSSSLAMLEEKWRSLKCMCAAEQDALFGKIMVTLVLPICYRYECIYVRTKRSAIFFSKKEER